MGIVCHEIINALWMSFIYEFHGVCGPGVVALFVTRSFGRRQLSLQTVTRCVSMFSVAIIAEQLLHLERYQRKLYLYVEKYFLIFCLMPFLL